MYCPECGTEYREGLKVCADCHVQLVDEQPPAPQKPKPVFVDFQEILATYNPADVAFIKSLLESEGIDYFFKGEHFLSIRPLADPSRLMVRIDQVAAALELLKDVKLTIKGINISDKKDKR